MAGEWIKVSTNIHTKPEVFKLARLLSEPVDVTVALLVRFWCWADSETVDGVVDGIESCDVDAVVRKDGFCDGLISVGWLRKLPDRPGIEIVNFSRHNGESAKKRTLKNERQARWRAGKVDAGASTNSPTREEKRREDINSGSSNTVSNNTSETAPPVDNHVYRSSSSTPKAAAHSTAKAKRTIEEQRAWKTEPIPDWAKKFIKPSA